MILIVEQSTVQKILLVNPLHFAYSDQESLHDVSCQDSKYKGLIKARNTPTKEDSNNGLD